MRVMARIVVLSLFLSSPGHSGSNALSTTGKDNVFVCPACGHEISERDWLATAMAEQQAWSGERNDSYLPFTGTGVSLLAPPMRCEACRHVNLGAYFNPKHYPRIEPWFSRSMHVAANYLHPGELPDDAGEAPSYFIFARIIEDMKTATDKDGELPTLGDYLDLGSFYAIAARQAEGRVGEKPQGSPGPQYIELSLREARRCFDRARIILNDGVEHGYLDRFADKLLYSLVDINRKLGDFERAAALLPECRIRVAAIDVSSLSERDWIPPPTLLKMIDCQETLIIRGDFASRVYPDNFGVATIVN